MPRTSLPQHASFKNPLSVVGRYEIEGHSGTVTVRVEIDIEKIARDVGWKANTNRSKRATALGGAIVVEVV